MSSTGLIKAPFKVKIAEILVGIALIIAEIVLVAAILLTFIGQEASPPLLGIQTKPSMGNQRNQVEKEINWLTCKPKDPQPLLRGKEFGLGSFTKSIHDIVKVITSFDQLSGNNARLDELTVWTRIQFAIFLYGGVDNSANHFKVGYLPWKLT